MTRFGRTVGVALVAMLMAAAAFPALVLGADGVPATSAQTLVLAAVLTVAGCASFAPLVTGIISLANTLGVGFVKGNEARAAAIISLAIVVAGVVSAIQVGALGLGIDGLFTGFTAWYTLSTLSTSIYDDIKGKPSSLRAGLTQGSGT